MKSPMELKKLTYIIILLTAVTLSGCKKDNWLDWKVQNELFMESPILLEPSLPVYTTASGLKYQVEAQGNQWDTKPGSTSVVTVDYAGYLINGSRFDGGTAQFYVSSVVSGFAEGLKLMNVHGDYILYIPWELGYGKDGNEASEGGSAFIPPYSTLIFRVHLSASQSQ